jgi:hypothetical protein
MANVKKGLLVPQKGASDWWKHLRRVGKRLFWKSHRQAERKHSQRETRE